jgi:hypothetical protein
MKSVIVGAAMLIVLTRADLAVAQTPQERIDAATAHAVAAGVPVSLLESKVAEGKAKGIPMDRIAAAIERREMTLERANQTLRGRPDVTPADLAVSADALDSGVSTAVLKAISDSAPRDRRVVAIAALTELVRQGRVPEAALERVREALKRGPDALANLPAQAAAEGGGHGKSDTQPSNGNSGNSGNNGNNGNNGRGGAQGPPASVPAPGASTQPTNPEKPDKPGKGGKPSDPGKPATTPAPSAGRGRSGGA